MTRILGLDLGTNSVGWAVVDKQFVQNNEPHQILKNDEALILHPTVHLRTRTLL